MKISVNKKDPLEIEAKRINLPVKITSKCPECGTPVTVDFSSEDCYLSYITLNAEEEIVFQHDTECESDIDDEAGLGYHEWSEHVVFGITCKGVK